MQPDAQSSERHCVACGYNLFGLGDEPRCPECGLLNVPDGYRREVWELVDSGKWFFSGFFTPFKKRPPGWWWSLDRPGDVRRAVRFAAICISLSLGAVVLAAAVAGSLIICMSFQYTYIDPDLRQVTVRTAYNTYFDRSFDLEKGTDWTDLHASLPRATSVASTPRFSPNSRFLAVAVPLCLLMLLLWILPAQVGLWTQIRKGLPDFARAPCTIIAASCYEAHFLIYLALLFVLWILIDVLVRLADDGTSGPWNVSLDMSLWFFFLAFMLFGTLRWVGPLRSDYTKQLIRSRTHQLRIFLMYAIGLPSLFAIGISALIYIWRPWP